MVAAVKPNACLVFAAPGKEVDLLLSTSTIPPLMCSRWYNIFLLQITPKDACLLQPEKCSV